MKIIYINSKKYGVKKCLVDDEDYERVSKINWCITATAKGTAFYAKGTTSLNKRETMHRFIMCATEDEEVDHRDFDTLNNQKNNLRKCTHQQNMHHRRKTENRKSKYLGVYFGRGMYCAQIRVNYKNKHIGSFKTELEAAVARDEAALKYHGEFAQLNFPPRIGQVLNQMLNP